MTDRQSELRRALEVIGFTPEKAQERAAWLWRAGCEPDALRASVATVEHFNAAGYFNAACMEAWPPEPVLKVGDLASWCADRVRVDYIGKRSAFFTTATGGEASAPIAALTPLGEPAPDDWGQG